MAEEGKIAGETGEKIGMAQFTRLLLGGFIRDSEKPVDRFTIDEDEEELLEYLETGESGFECFHTADTKQETFRDAEGNDWAGSCGD